MPYLLLHRSRAETRRFVSALRGKLVSVVIAGIAIAIIVMAAFVLTLAYQQRENVLQSARERAEFLAQAVDREISGYLQLLRGLSTSPAIQAQDLKAIYDQLLATPAPDGVWFIFSDTQRQLIHTRRPLGSQLFPLRPGTIDRIRAHGLSVSERATDRYHGGHVMAVSLRVDNSKGEMTNVLTCIVSGARLAGILRGVSIPSGWAATAADREFAVVATTERAQRHGGQAVLDQAVIEAIRSHPEGLLRLPASEQEPGQWVAYRRASMSNLIVTVSVPLALVNAPLSLAAKQLLYGSLAIIVISCLVGWIMASRLAAPVEVLRKFAAFTESRLRSTQAQLHSAEAAYSRRLAALQDEERRRIAAELHDSTQQHLVAIDLYLTQLRNLNAHVPGAHAPLRQMSQSLAHAQQELRIFTYLLYPPDLAADGLAKTLREFVDGFARRTGLIGGVRVADETEKLPLPIQQCVLRVVQEALANVHRHARATSFLVEIEIANSMLRLSVTDNGLGLATTSGAPVASRLGVGIPGMRSRIKERGGTLSITSGAAGTALVALIPLAVARGRQEFATPAEALPR